MGTVPVYGNAPAVALSNTNGEARNVLMMGTGEFGHCLKTAVAARLKSECVNVYALEQHPETLARHCVLMATALDTNVGLRERTELFLEIYGNAYLSLRGLEYVKERAAQVARVLSGHATPEDQPLVVALDFSLLKHKELDEVLDVVLQWKAGTVLDMDKYWDQRLRQYYKQRYDTRKNAADWDYHMKLVDLKHPIIGGREFLKWRLHGVAFEFRDTSYTVPNVTMGTWVEGRRKGCSILARGYWSDIVNSPYIAHGLEADSEKLFKVRNREQVYTACDVSEYNISQMLHTLLTGEVIQPRVVSSGQGSFADDRPSEEDLDAQGSGVPPVDLSVPAVCLTLVLGNTKVLDRARYHGLFDAAVVSNLAAGQATETLNKLLHTAPGVGACVTLETAKFVLDFRNDHKTEFLRRLYVEASKAGWLVRGAPPTEGQAQNHVCFAYSGDGGLNGEWNPVPELEVPEKLKQAEEDKPKKPRAVAEIEESPSEGNESCPLTVTAKGGDVARDSVNALTQVEVAVIERNPDRVTRRPRELLVKVRLPGVTSAAGVDMKFKEKSIRVDHMEANLHADVVLPYVVDDDAGSATFDPEKNLLVLTLPVVVPKEEEKQALQHLEESTDKIEISEDAEGQKSQDEDHIMVRQQALRGMSLPQKLCSNNMLI